MSNFISPRILKHLRENPTFYFFAPVTNQLLTVTQLSARLTRNLPVRVRQRDELVASPSGRLVCRRGVDRYITSVEELLRL